MAEVANPPGLSRQLSLVMLVRWQTFRNRLRGESEEMHMVGTVALGLFFAALTLGASAGICFAAFAAARTRTWFFVSLILWGIFLFWQLVPVLASEMNPGFDGRNLLRFPLRFSAFFLMSAAYGLADPFALAGILWHLAIGVGVSMARPDLVWWAALALALSVIVNLLFNRAVFAWLERVLAKRRARELVTAIFILLIVCVQFSGLILQRWGPALRRAPEGSASVLRALPPALAATVIEHAANGDSAVALRTAGLLGIYALVFGGLFESRLHAQFTGEDLGESAAPVRRIPRLQRVPVSVPPATGAVAGQASSVARSLSRIVSAPVAAMFVKEIRYFYRNSMLMMNVFMPLILIVFLSVTSSMPRRQGGPSLFGRFGGNIAYPVAVAYIVMLMMNFYPNNLAYEGRGVERLFLAPVQFRDVMLAKNLFHGALLVLEALIALALVTATGHRPGALIILTTWTALPFAALILLGVGNWLSLVFPRRFEFGVRRQRPSGMTMIISFALFFAMMGILSAAAWLCIWRVGLWLLPLVYITFSAGALLVYRLILEGTSRLAITRRDSVLEELSR
jgi:ABC-2 type transport system permease protein